MAAFGESYCRDNKGAKFRLISHEPRPSLTLFPAETDKRPMTFRFMEAVQRLTPNFTKAEWGKIYEKVGNRLHLNQLQKVFVVLRDDDRPSGTGSISSGSNSEPLSASDPSRGRQGLRKRPAESSSSSLPGPTPVKSSRGRVH